MQNWQFRDLCMDMQAGLLHPLDLQFAGHHTLKTFQTRTFQSTFCPENDSACLLCCCPSHPFYCTAIVCFVGSNPSSRLTKEMIMWNKQLLSSSVSVMSDSNEGDSETAAFFNSAFDSTVVFHVVFTVQITKHITSRAPWLSLEYLLLFLRVFFSSSLIAHFRASKEKAWSCTASQKNSKLHFPPVVNQTLYEFSMTAFRCYIKLTLSLHVHEFKTVYMSHSSLILQRVIKKKSGLENVLPHETYV